MLRRASRFRFTPLAVVLSLAALGPARAFAQQAEELPTDGHQALKDDFDKFSDRWINHLRNGADPADPAKPEDQQAIDSAARWATYRVTWGLEKEPEKFSLVLGDFNADLQSLRIGGEKSQKAAEMYVKAVIGHALEVLQTRKPIARINAAMMLDHLANRTTDEKTDDVLHRLAGGNQAALADALAGIIKDPNQLDAAKFWAFKGLEHLLALPQTTPPVLPREKEEAALGEVLKFLQARNKPLPPGTPDEEIDGLRYLRRQAIKALAQGRYPTLSTLPDKPRPTLTLLKIAANDNVQPEARLDERVEAAIGVAHAQPALDKDYQPDYAAHQLGLFAADFVKAFDAEKRTPGTPPTLAWKIEASRLAEALELMKAQAKNAHVALVVDETLKALTAIERASSQPNVTDLENKLKTESPAKELYKGAADSTVTFGGQPPMAPAPPKPEEKKDK